MPNLRVAFDKRMDRAKKNIAYREQIEQKSRNPLARECGPSVYLAAAISAIETGLTVEDWDAVAEGLVMLEDLRMKYALVLGGKRKQA